jgi:uncharacterized membrane-anchored protein
MNVSDFYVAPHLKLANKLEQTDNIVYEVIDRIMRECAQEQKMKCIGWELATYDYEYRYKFTQKPLGECSSYDEKEKIFNDIIYQIVKHGKKIKCKSSIKK